MPRRRPPAGPSHARTTASEACGRTVKFWTTRGPPIRACDSRRPRTSSIRRLRFGSAIARGQSVIPCAQMLSPQPQPCAAASARSRSDSEEIHFAPALQEELDAQGVSAPNRKPERARPPAASKTRGDDRPVRARDQTNERKPTADASPCGGPQQPPVAERERAGGAADDSAESDAPCRAATDGKLDALTTGVNASWPASAAAAAWLMGVAPMTLETPDAAVPQALATALPEELLPVVAAQAGDTGGPIPHEAFTIGVSEEPETTVQSPGPPAPNIPSQPSDERQVAVPDIDHSKRSAETQEARGAATKLRPMRSEAETSEQRQPQEEARIAFPSKAVLPGPAETVPPRADSRSSSSSPALIPDQPRPVQETPRQVQDITLKLEGPNQEKIRLQVTRLGHGLRVTVHANTPETAQSLRGSLPQLLSRFEKSGFRPDAPLTSGGVAGPSRLDESFAGSRESLHDQSQGETQRQPSDTGGGRRHRRSWMEEWGRLSYHDDL